MNEDLQKHINNELRDDIKKLYSHADVANREMGVMSTKVALIEQRIKNIETMMSKVDSRTWWILGTLILGILIEIFFKVK